MTRIKQLPVEVANQISAGEVIERPASVVKELVENSIDAGSTQIMVEVENGGKESIRVLDNGSGIGEDDLEMAFSRYATSKIEGINDLYSLATLGFRGEALASIASVSRVELRTRTRDQLKGYYLKLEGGKVLKKEPVAVNKGTDIIVQDLFYNTPARFKYLKTTSTEYGHVSNIIEREALARPEIKFTLNHNRKKVLSTPGSGKLIDAIYALFGQDLALNLIPIEFQDRYIKVSGFLANPNFHRSSRLYEYFFVNNRVVYNPILSRGLEAGYRGLLPAGARPIAFLNLSLNKILVDINVHPTKREVKFSRDEIIQDVLKKGISRVLRENDAAPRLKFKQKKVSRVKPVKLKYDLIDIEKPELIKDQGDNENKANREETRQESTEMKKVSRTDRVGIENTDGADRAGIESRQRESAGLEKANQKNNVNLSKDNREDRTGRQGVSDSQLETKKAGPTEPGGKIKKLLGQISGTYLLAESTDGLYIIDQHNAHERVRYERFKEEYNKHKIVSQSLLIPINLETNLQEAETVKYHLESLEKMGFLIEEFGGQSFLVQEVPAILKNTPLKNLLREIIDKLMDTGKTGDISDLNEELIALISCRGAIKAGKKLSREEMERLLTDLFKTANPYHCPHGRPVLLKISEAEIAREMGRNTG